MDRRNTLIVPPETRQRSLASAQRVHVEALLVLAAVVSWMAVPATAAGNAGPPAAPYAWQLERVDTNGDTGQYTSLALDAQGSPYVVYVDATNGTVRLAHQVAGLWTTERIDGPSTYLGNTNVLVDTNGTVHVSYFDALKAVVKYGVRGMTGWNVTVVDSGYADGYNRLALDSAGRPVLVYSWINGVLRYAAWNGTGWTRETVDDVSLISRYPDLSLDATDRPYISYYAEGYLRYATKVGYIWVHERVDPTPYAGLYSRIRLDGAGDPHIAYYDSSNGTLRYATRANGNWTHVVVDGQNDAGWDVSFVFDPFGRAQLSYYARITGSLRYAILTTDGWIRETVDDDGVVGWYTGLAVNGSGMPRISYYDWSNGDLKFAEAVVALQARTIGASRLGSASVVLWGELVALGNHSAADLSFEFREAGSAGWTVADAGNASAEGRFSANLSGLPAGATYEFRAVARAGNETSYGEIRTFIVAVPATPSPPYLLIGAAAAATVAFGVIVYWRTRRAGRRAR